MNFASKTITLAGALTNTNAIKTSVATVASPVTYSTTGINGSIGLTTMKANRIITATSTSAVASYVPGSVITITGTDSTGAVQTDTMTVVGADGGESLATTKFFKTVVSITIAAQVDTAGAWVFGVSDASVPSCIQLRVGTTPGTLHLGFADGSTDTILAVALGEAVPTSCNRIYADSTAVGITAFIQ